MNCARFEDAVHEYYRGTLSAAEHTGVERHAEECPTCGELKRACEETCCKDFVDLLPEFLEPGFAPEERRRFQRHLALCADCRTYLESYRTTLELTESAFHAERVEPLPESLVQSILSARRPPERR